MRVGLWSQRVRKPSFSLVCAECGDAGAGSRLALAIGALVLLPRGCRATRLRRCAGATRRTAVATFRCYETRAFPQSPGSPPAVGALSGMCGPATGQMPRLGGEGSSWALPRPAAYAPRGVSFVARSSENPQRARKPDRGRDGGGAVSRARVDRGSGVSDRGGDPVAVQLQEVVGGGG